MKSIYRIFTVCLLFASSFSYAQTIEIITDNQTRSAYENKSYVVVGSLRLLPGFHFTATSTSTFFVQTVGGMPTSPTGDQNFVKEEVMLVPGLSSDAQVSAAGVSSKSTIYRYFDDAGRRIQQVSVGASPSMSDIVRPQYYDALGRPTKKYLPYVGGVDGSYRSAYATEQSSFYTTPPAKVMGDSKPYKDVSFDGSPLNRVTQVIPEGSAWTSANAIKTVFKLNAASTVRQWTISGSLPVSSGTYAEGSLTVQERTDEEGKVHREYSDFRGLLIMVEDQMPGGQTAQTYYVHNLYGAVVFIIPPKAATIYSPVAADADKWYYQYEYDQYQRVIGTKAPGVAWKYKIYDKWDRVVLTQDGNQRANSQWEFQKYDDLNRLVASGIYTTPDSRSTLTTNAGSATGRYESAAPATAVGYTLNATFPTTVTETDLRTIVYYDNYNFLSYTDWDVEHKVFTFVPESGFTGSQLTTIKDRATGSKVRVLDTNQWLNSVTYYDNKYRAIQNITENHFGQLDRLTREYDFTGKILKTIKVHTNSEPETITIRQRFTYDHTGRLVDTYHQVQSQPEILIARIEYNALGQPIDKKIHSGDNGTTWLQSVDYRFNIRGWKTNINNTSADSGDPTDLYGQDMAYNTAQSGNTLRYDGLISGARWKHDLSTKDRIFNLTYDKGMLTSATYKVDGGIIPQTGIYNEDGITYDVNGNIRTLRRSSGLTTATVTDSLTYHYGASGNQLLYVKDASGSPIGFSDQNTGTDDYAYDANGNLIKDKNKGIDRTSPSQGILYNEKDLPRQINLSNNRHIFIQYDAIGRKLYQTLIDDSTNPVTQIKRTDYVGEFVYVDGKPDFIAHPGGRLVPASNNNLITDVSTREATSTTNYTTINSVTTTAITAGGQSYLNVVSNQAGGTPGIVSIGGNIPVSADESYVFKILGYQSAGTSAALYVRNASGAALSIPVTTLPIGSAAENWVSVRFVIPHTGVTAINVGVLFNTPATNDAFRINRVALYKGDWEYQYFLKDHIGSPRVVLQSAPTTWTYLATMESVNHANENDQFLRLNSSHEVSFAAANHTAGGSYAYRMSAADSIGPSRTFKVLPGDVVDASVWSYYPSGATYSKAGVTAMAAAVVTALAGGNTMLTSGIDQAYSNSGAGGSHPLWMLSQDQTSSKPSAFINYILFDETYTPLEAKSTPVGAADALTQIALPTINVQQTGYLLVYLSYDDTNDDLAHDVYFDDFQIVFHESSVVQINSYYAFGMPAFSWMRDGENENRYLFQGKEMISDVAWQDFGSRMYDSELGRWFAADPANQFMSPYLAFGNNPFNNVDPNGQISLKKIALIAVAIAVAVVTDGIGESLLVPELTIVFGEATEVVVGVATGAFSGAVGGGLLSEHKFGTKAFWHDVAVGAFAGGVGGAVAGALPEAAEGADFWTKFDVGSDNGFIIGASGGFAYGFAQGVNEGGHSFIKDLEMGLTSAYLTSLTGAVTGALEESIGFGKAEGEAESAAAPASEGDAINGELEYLVPSNTFMGAKVPTAAEAFFRKFHEFNWLGSIIGEVTDHLVDEPKESMVEELNHYWWNIDPQEEEEENGEEPEGSGDGGDGGD